MNHEDMRVRRTKKLLTEALGALLGEQSFSSITVNMLCERAMVHRTTFYKHFYDKYDLLSYWLEEMIVSYIAIDFETRINAPFQSLQHLTDDITLNIAKKQEEDPEFFETLRKKFVEIYQMEVKMHLNHFNIAKDIPGDLIFYVYGANLFGMIDWVKTNQIKMNPHELDEIFRKICSVQISRK